MAEGHAHRERAAPWEAPMTPLAIEAHAVRADFRPAELASDLEVQQASRPAWMIGAWCDLLLRVSADFVLGTTVLCSSADFALAYVATCRSALEAAGQARWIAAPSLAPTARIERYVRHRYAGAMAADVVAANEQQRTLANDQLGLWERVAASYGIPRVVPKRPPKPPAKAYYFGKYPLAQSTGLVDDLFLPETPEWISVYRVLSAVAHSQAHGLGEFASSYGEGRAYRLDQSEEWRCMAVCIAGLGYVSAVRCVHDRLGLSHDPGLEVFVSAAGALATGLFVDSESA